MSAPAARPAPAGLRRAAFLRAAAATALAPTLLARPASSAAHGARRLDDWPLPARDLAATRSAPRGPRALDIRWRQPLAGGLTGAPAIVGGVVVAAQRRGEGAALEHRDRGAPWRPN